MTRWREGFEWNTGQGSWSGLCGIKIDEVYVEDGYCDKVSGFYSCDLSRYLKVYPNYGFSILKSKR
jgi:hypothetical protein